MNLHETAVDFPVAATAAEWGEHQLVTELRAGSVDAFNYVIAMYHRPLYRFVIRVMGDSDDAPDVLQEIFLKVFRSASHFEGKSSLKTWLYQIALHEASNHRRWWRRHKRQETSIEAGSSETGSWAERLPDGGDSPLRQALRGEEQQLLQQALRRVPQPFQAVLVLREIEGFRYDEIAEIVQARVGTVKSRLMRGREMLRQQLLCARAAGTAERPPAAAMGGSGWNGGSVQHG